MQKNRRQTTVEKGTAHSFGEEDNGLDDRILQDENVIGNVAFYVFPPSFKFCSSCLMKPFPFQLEGEEDHRIYSDQATKSLD